MTENQNRKLVYGVTALLLIAVAGLTVWAVWKTITAIQQDEPLLYKNEKNLKELNRPSLLPDGLDEMECSKC